MQEGDSLQWDSRCDGGEGMGCWEEGQVGRLQQDLKVEMPVSGARKSR